MGRRTKHAPVFEGEQKASCINPGTVEAMEMKLERLFPPAALLSSSAAAAEEGDRGAAGGAYWAKGTAEGLEDKEEEKEH